MGKPSRDKGLRMERALVNALQDAGLAAERVPLSGAAGGKFRDDISYPLLGRDHTGEAKWRKNGFKQIYDWLGSSHTLFIKRDRSPTLVVIRLDDALEIAAAAEKGRG